MTDTLKPRPTTLGAASADKYASRYIFYPLKKLSFPFDRAVLYNRTIPRAKIVLLESVEYWDESDNLGVLGGPQQELRVASSKSQVAYLMGHIEGGYMLSGMTFLDNLTGYDTEVVREIENFIFPSEGRPDTLVALKAHIAEAITRAEGVLAKDIIATGQRMIDGIDRAIRHCSLKINEIEAEISDSRTGNKLAMKSGLTARDKYLYNQIGRSLPEDKAGVNVAQELGRILAGAIGGNVPKTPEQEMEDVMVKQELVALKRELEEKDRLIQELAGYETDSAE